jgi:predicted SprT family Zn-dependent metalloprotease
VAGVTPRYELSRKTQKFRISDKKVKRSLKLVKGQEVSLKEAADHNIVSQIYFTYTCECRWILHKIQNKPKVVRSVAFSLQR